MTARQAISLGRDSSVEDESFRRQRRATVLRRKDSPPAACTRGEAARPTPSPQPPVPSPRPGFSLLEVILALAILAGSMAVLGQLVQMGMSHARRAEDMTQAAILCESIMAEIVCGARSPTATFETISDENGESQFVVSVLVTPSEQQAGMLEVIVVVESDPESFAEPVSCQLIRWIVDPDYAASLSETTAG